MQAKYSAEQSQGSRWRLNHMFRVLSFKFCDLREEQLVPTLSLDFRIPGNRTSHNTEEDWRDWAENLFLAALPSLNADVEFNSIV